MTQVKTFFKEPKPWRSEEYKHWVSSFPCCLTTPKWFLPSQRGEVGLSDPHHEAPEHTKGMSTKPGDEHTIPARHNVHNEMESTGHSRPEVWKKYGQDPILVKLILWELWKRKTGEYPGNAEYWIGKYAKESDNQPIEERTPVKGQER